MWLLCFYELSAGDRLVLDVFMRAAALFFLIGVVASILSPVPAFAAEIQPTSHNQKSKIGHVISENTLRKNRRIAQIQKTRRAASAGASHKRFAGSRAEINGLGQRILRRPTRRSLARPETVDARSAAWMGRLEIIGMADGADTPEPSAHGDIAGQAIAAGKFGRLSADCAVAIVDRLADQSRL